MSAGLSPLHALDARRPAPPIPPSAGRDALHQALGTATIVTGGWYMAWRWGALAQDALWLAVPVAMAETLAYVGSVLHTVTTWRTEDTPTRAPPETAAEIDPDASSRPVAVDVFIATYDEDVELVRLSARDALAMRYPHPIDLRVHVCDDGRRDAMRAMAEAEGASYITRASNEGFKAGNLRSAMDQTSGDLIVIFDADTRAFPAFLEETLGYFRDPSVAWVQTPQWFYDLDEGAPLPAWMAARLGRTGAALGAAVERVIGPVRVGADLLGNDATSFYEVIQRRRNWANASFCCGAGSIHRRETLMAAALRTLAARVEWSVARVAHEVEDESVRAALADAMTAEAVRQLEVTPYEFHVSEDIYTSVLLHATPGVVHRSVFHPRVLTRMLSPQDLLAWTIQRYKYAGGTLDIFLHNPLSRFSGLRAWQRLMYGATVYSYLSPLWIPVTLLTPLIHMYFGVAPLRGYDLDLLRHLVPFLAFARLTALVRTWGVSSWRAEQYYLASFWLNARALYDVVRHKPVKFHVTPKVRTEGLFLSLVAPHIAILALTAGGLVVTLLRASAGASDLGATLFNAYFAIFNAAAISVVVRAALGTRGGAAC